MFKPNPIQRLYPNLQFHKITPSQHTFFEPPKRSLSEPPVQTKPQPPKKVIEKREKTPIKEVKKVEIREPTPPKSPVVEEKVETPKKPKNTVKRPNRLKPEPKPEPQRETPIPKKGERGLQKKYTMDQRKDMYLNKLSRKSIKNAEKEISKINEVIESVDGDHQKLEEVERHLKSQLKLINTAKFFTLSTKEDNNNIIENVNNTPREETTPQESPTSPISQGSSGST